MIQILNYISIVIFLMFLKNSEARKLLLMNNIEDCPGHQNLPIMTTRFKVRNHAKDNRTVEHSYLVKKDIDGEIVGYADMFKCDVTGAPDTCEFFVKDYKITELCRRMGQKGKGWSTSVESCVPKLDCPIRAGNYTCHTAIAADSIFKFLPIPAGIWKSRMTLFLGKEMLFCQDVVVKVMDVMRA